jgi:hypothetical protein
MRNCPFNCRTEWEEEEGGKVRAQYSVEPSPGTHLLRYKGSWIRLQRVREQQQVDVIGGCKNIARVNVIGGCKYIAWVNVIGGCT